MCSLELDPQSRYGIVPRMVVTLVWFLLVVLPPLVRLPVVRLPAVFGPCRHHWSCSAFQRYSIPSKPIRPEDRTFSNVLVMVVRKSIPFPHHFHDNTLPTRKLDPLEVLERTESRVNHGRNEFWHPNGTTPGETIWESLDRQNQAGCGTIVVVRA